MRVKVTKADAGILIQPARKSGSGFRTGYDGMHAVTLANVTVHPDGISGELLEEFTEPREPGEVLLRHMLLVVHNGETLGTETVREVKGKKVVTFSPVVGRTFKAGYVNGTDFYVSKR